MLLVSGDLGLEGEYPSKGLDISEKDEEIGEGGLKSSSLASLFVSGLIRGLRIGAVVVFKKKVEATAR
jgi:hypothetical protein